MRAIASFAIATCLLSASAQAQNMGLDPTFEEVTLSAGFENDPYPIKVISGGEIDASQLGGNCTGFIADAPDIRLNYEAGDFPLFFGAVADGDTTLVINGPDGQWYCDDDSWDDGDPMVRFADPMSGQYDIWVGSFDPSENLETGVAISEAAGFAGD